MALIAMATYCTPENCTGGNPRNNILCTVLTQLAKVTDWSRHRMILIDNSPGEFAAAVYSDFNFFEVITNGKNIGTAEAINLAWKQRKPGEHCVKMDDDCFIHNEGWADQLEATIERDPTIGIIGLKRNDLIENPKNTNEFYRSELAMLPKTPAQRWIVVERVNHVIGTCQMYNSLLLDKIGYLYQPEAYGFDDVWASIRSKGAGFYNCFLPHIAIDHIDPGDTGYQKKKENHAGQFMKLHHELSHQWNSGEKDLYYEPEWGKQKSYQI